MAKLAFLPDNLPGSDNLAPFADVACPASSQASETVDVTISTALLTLPGRLGKLADSATNENRPYSEWTITQGKKNLHRHTQYSLSG
jgi:hypothetical protein